MQKFSLMCDIPVGLNGLSVTSSWRESLWYDDALMKALAYKKSQGKIKETVADTLYLYHKHCVDKRGAS